MGPSGSHPVYLLKEIKIKQLQCEYGGEEKAWQLHERIREKQPFRLNTDGKTLFGFSGVLMKGIKGPFRAPSGVAKEEKQPFRLNTDDKTLSGFSGVLMRGVKDPFGSRVKL